MGEKGQVVIPKSIRDHLHLAPKTKFVVYGKGDILMLKRISVPDVRREFEDLFAHVDKKRLGLTEEDIAKEVKARRKERRR